MPARRKLFLTHAGELAHLLARAVGSGGLVAGFVNSYAARFNRRGLTADAQRLRELQSTIGREALLVIAIDLRHQFRSAFTQRPGAAPSPDEAAFAEIFYQEFLASLVRAMDWSAAEAPAETAALLRDLDLYGQWSLRPSGRPSLSGAVAGLGITPFADRCALLLDPAMMEQARRAGAEFEPVIMQTGRSIFSRLGRQAPSTKRPSSPTKRPNASTGRPVSQKKRPASSGKRARPASPRQAPPRSSGPTVRKSGPGRPVGKSPKHSEAAAHRRGTKKSRRY